MARKHFESIKPTWRGSPEFLLAELVRLTEVKNDHLGFSVLYVHAGVVRKYYPDFIVEMKSGKFLVLETKGQVTDESKSKHAYMKDWVEAVNAHGGFGEWAFAVSKTPADIKDILSQANK